MSLSQTTSAALRGLRRVDIPTAIAVCIAALWICGFLWYFFRQSIEDPTVPRTEVWSIIADELLGLGDAESNRQFPIRPSGMRFLSQRVPLFTMAAFILVLASIHGDAVCLLILRRCRLLWTEQIVLILGTGLGLQSLVTLGCGLAGQLNRTAIIIPALLSLLLTSVVRWKSRSHVAHDIESAAAEIRSSPAIRILVLLIIVPFAIYLLLGAVTPPTDFDVREYHLQGPKEWFQQGQITFLPHNVYTSFPFLSEMLSLTGMVFAADWWRGALVGQVVLSVFQLLSALSVFSIARRWISADVAWLAVLIYLTTPWTLRISLIPYAEGALTFYLITATMSALLITRLPTSIGRMAVITGLLAGNAMASKYTGLISVILPTAVLVAFQILKHQKSNDSLVTDSQPDSIRQAINEKRPPVGCRSEDRSAYVARPVLRSGSLRGDHQPGDSIPAARPAAIEWRSLLMPAAGFGLGVAAMIAPWLLKNLVETGNPVYPLAYSVVGGSEWSPQLDARWRPAHAASEHDLRRIPEHILGAAVYNKWTSALLFALAVPSILLWRRCKTLPIVLSLIVWGFVTWWALTHRIDRFWIPLIPLLSLAAATAWLISESRIWKAFLGIMIAAVTLFNLRFCGLALVGFHVGLMDLDVARQVPVRSDISYLNLTLPADAKVLMVGEAEVFDATFPLLYNTVFDDCLFEGWTSLSEDKLRSASERRMLPPEQILRQLRQRGVTHVYVNWGSVLRYRMTYGYTEYVAPERFRQLLNDGVLESSRVLLRQPWTSLSDQERAMVESWQGYKAIVPNGADFSVAELYPVTPP